MKKSIKIMLSVLLAIILLVIIAIISVPIFVDPNRYKPEIAAALKEQTGRELIIEGNIEFALFPSLGLTTGVMSVSNASGFDAQSFIKVAASHVSIDLLSLVFEKKIAINEIELKGLVLNLVRNGLANNWDDLFKTASKASISPSKPSAQSMPAEDSLALLAVGRISITDSQIRWQDLQAGDEWLVKDVNLETEAFRFNEPTNIKLSLLAGNVKTGFSAAIKLNTTSTSNNQLDSFVLTHTELQSTLAGQNIPSPSLAGVLTVDEIVLALANQAVKVSGAKLAVADVIMNADFSGVEIKNAPEFTGQLNIAAFNPANLLKVFAIAVPVMQDANALNALSLQSSFRATAESIELENLLATLDDTHAQGRLKVSHLSQPEIGFDLALDGLLLDRYLPPSDKSPKSLASPGAALAAGLSALPVETIRKLNADGQLTFEKLSVRGVDLKGLGFKLRAKNGNVSTQQSAKSFNQGTYSGHLSVDSGNTKPVIALTEQLTKVQLEPLLKGRFKQPITGQLTTTVQLQAQWRSADEWKSTLNGQVNLLLKDAVIRGFNLQKIIDNGKALVNGDAKPADSKNDQAIFSEITGTAIIKNGLLRNDDLVATSAKLNVDGKGTANLVDETLNYQLNARLPPVEPDQAQSPPLLVKVTGPFDNLNYAIDASALITDKARIEKVLDKNKDKINKLMNKLDKKLGSGTSDLLKGLFH
ncbi:MAG: AsmA family protein [Methylococcales bacterium]|nr:AsmA family protein [Methylococcaceae bacterium]